MAIVSLVNPGTEESASSLKAELVRLLQPFSALFEPAPEQALLYLGHLYPAGPELGVNPQPRLLAALAEWLYEAGVRQVQLAARAAPGFDFAQCWRLGGFTLLQSYAAPCVDLSRAPSLPRQSRLALALRELLLPQPLLQADLLINVGKFRVAEGELFGSALSNLAAMTELTAPAELLPRALVDLFSVIAPDLHVQDGLRGTRGWQPQRRDVILAATDACALDMTLAALAGLPAGSSEQLALAGGYGLGSANAADIQLLGELSGLFTDQ